MLLLLRPTIVAGHSPITTSAIGVDEGSVGGPAIGGTAADQVKARNALRKCQKRAYSMLSKHVLDEDHVTHICVTATSKMGKRISSTCRAHTTGLRATLRNM